MRSPQRLARFVIVAFFGMAVQLVIVALLTIALPVEATMASIAGVLAALAHNFAWHVRWTWRDRRPGASLPAALVRFLAGNGLVSLVGTAGLIPILTAARVPPIAANVVAIASCGIANFMLADRYAFSIMAKRSHHDAGRNDPGSQGRRRYPSGDPAWHSRS